MGAHRFFEALAAGEGKLEVTVTHNVNFNFSDIALFASVIVLMVTLFGKVLLG